MRNISQAVAVTMAATVPTAPATATALMNLRRQTGIFKLEQQHRRRPPFLSPTLTTHSYKKKVVSFSFGIEQRISISSSSSSSRNGVFSFCTVSSTDSTVIESSLEDNQNENKITIKDAAKMLDIRVGRIIKAWRHEEADSLYVEEVDIGESEPRLICSGLVNFIPLHQLLDQRVIVLANLKPRNMRGVKSFGMLMAASDLSHENVELLFPPEGSIPGERIWFGSEDEKENQPVAATPNQIQKKKIWEMVQPHLKTDDSCSAILGGEHAMRTSAGVVTCKSLKNANIS